MCNLKKGPNLSGIDPASRDIVRLFHPREDSWAEHFVAVAKRGAVEIKGLTAVGRATVEVLGLNSEMRQMVRHELWCEGLYSAVSDQ